MPRNNSQLFDYLICCIHSFDSTFSLEIKNHVMLYILTDFYSFAFTSWFVLYFLFIRSFQTWSSSEFFVCKKHFHVCQCVWETAKRKKKRKKGRLIKCVISEIKLPMCIWQHRTVLGGCFLFPSDLDIFFPVSFSSYSSDFLLFLSSNFPSFKSFIFFFNNFVLFFFLSRFFLFETIAID